MKPFLAPAIGMAIALVLPVGAPARDPGDPPVQTASTATDSSRFDVDISGNETVRAYCKYLTGMMEQIDGSILNIVVAPEAEEIALPTMMIRQVTFEQFAAFINRIGGSQQPEAGGSGREPREGGGLRPPGRRFGLTNVEGIWHFWAEPGASSVAGVAPERPVASLEPGDPVTTVFRLEGDIEATLGLLEEALAESRQQPDRPEPVLKFHEPSSSLIVRASQGDLELVESVLKSMREGNAAGSFGLPAAAVPPAAPTDRATDPFGAPQDESPAAGIPSQEADNRIKALEAKIAELEAALDKALAPAKPTG